MSVQSFVDTKCLAKFCRSVREVYAGLSWPVFPNNFYTIERFNSPDQHRRPLPLWASHDIAAIMHAVGKIDIQMP